MNDLPPRHPSELRLEAVFGHVHATRMRDVPLLNPSLRVEALGFRAWRGVRVGALVTPWSIILVILPDAPPAGTTLPAPGTAAAAPAVRRLPAGQSQVWTFPSGDYEFYGHEAPGLGCYHQCSLYSPVLAFATHADACAAAEAALDALFTAPVPAAPASPPPRRFSRRGLLTGT